MTGLSSATWKYRRVRLHCGARISARRIHGQEKWRKTTADGAGVEQRDALSGAGVRAAAGRIDRADGIADEARGDYASGIGGGPSSVAGRAHRYDRAIPACDEAVLAGVCGGE